MKLIVGLGNPGRKYEATRHNVGFEALGFLTGGGDERPRERFLSLSVEVNLGDERALLLWPQTFMNRSGQAVQQAVAFYKLATEDILVVCDDFNLTVGGLRMRRQGSSGGQKGLEDVCRSLATQEVPRLRIGIGPAPVGQEVTSFVLGKFRSEERELAEIACRDAAEAARCWATQGIVEAMNRFNRSADG